jgi:hypothetical protein
MIFREVATAQKTERGRGYTNVFYHTISVNLKRYGMTKIILKSEKSRKIF